MTPADQIRALMDRYAALRAILARVAPRYVPGAVGDGKADDTDAIQAALDRPAHAVPKNTEANGNLVYLPAGTYRVTRPLKVRGGTRLCGDGTATMIDGTAVTGNAPLIDLVGTMFDGPYNAGAQVRSLALMTRGHGIGCTTPGCTILDTALADLQICSEGWGVTFPEQYTQQLHVDGIRQYNPGSGGLRVKGNLNLIERYSIRRGVGGPAGNGFKSPWSTDKLAMIDVSDWGNTLRHCHVEFRLPGDAEPSVVLPFAVRNGWATLDDNWPEFQPASRFTYPDELRGAQVWADACTVYGQADNNGLVTIEYTRGGKRGTN